MFLDMFGGDLGGNKLEITGDLACFYIDPRRSSPGDASFLIDAFGIAVLQLLYGWLIGRSFDLTKVDFAYPSSTKTEFTTGLLSCPVSFDRPRNRMTFDAGCLNAPVVRSKADMSALLETFPYDLMLGRESGRPLACFTALHPRLFVMEVVSAMVRV